VRVTRRNFLVISAFAVVSGCRGTRGRSSARVVAWGGPGRRNGSFITPRAIGVDKGEVYVVDTTGRVQVFTQDGGFLRQWFLPESENGTPTCVAFDRRGRVLLPDTHYHQILVYSRGGELLDRWGSYGTDPDQFIYPTGIVEGPDGALYVSEYGTDAERMRVFDKDHRFVRQWGEFGEAPGQFNRAMAIEMGRDGTLYVVDTGNNRVQRFDTRGALLGVIGEPGTGPGQLKDPFDVAVAPDGSVFVCEYGNHRLSRFTASGEFLGATGGPGRNLGQFNAPRGVAVSQPGEGGSESRVYYVFVADTGNHRVQRLDMEVLD